jgi:hypothetical protein
MHESLKPSRLRAGLFCLVVILSGCGHSSPATPTPDGSTADVSTNDVSKPNGGDAGLSAATVESINDVTLGLAVATALSAPLAPDGAMVEADPGAPDTTTQGHAEHGFSGSSVVTPKGCAKYSWSKLTATVTLTGCTLEENGMPVSGTVSLGVATRPTVFTVTFTGLSVGTSTFGGEVALTMNGTSAKPAPPTLDVDVTYTSGGKSEQLSATGLTVATTSTSVAISGAATVTSGGSTVSVAATDLPWQTGECLPTSGTLKVSGGAPTATLTFLSTTPMDGKVTVQVPPLPATTEALFTPCS